MTWKIHCYNLDKVMQRKMAEAKIQSIQQMWNRETPGINKELEAAQIKTEYGNYLFNMLLDEKNNNLYIKEKNVINK
jgi:hypothetical protein